MLSPGSTSTSSSSAAVDLRAEAAPSEVVAVAVRQGPPPPLLARRSLIIPPPIFPLSNAPSRIWPLPLVDLDRMDGIFSVGDPNFPETPDALSDRAAPQRLQSLNWSDDEEDDDDDGDLEERIGGLHHNDVYLPVAPANFAARLGLNDTELTTALVKGEFADAERIIAETSDPEFLNEGVHAATPLNLALAGRASYGGNARHLKIARMLVRKGANVNLRIPHHDMENASESPLEMLVALYLALLKMFSAADKNEQYYETNLLDVIGLSGETGMSPHTVIAQTKELLHFFLERGADVNLQTADAGRTVFHMVLAAEVTDGELVEQMVTMGALVNLTDVHGTTPLMDVIRCSAKERGSETYKSLGKLDKRLLLDAQNCSGESALWRSMFHGKLSTSHLVLEEGAASFTMARVQENFLRRPNPSFTTYSRWLRRPPCISNLPALLAPFLCDSPCTSQKYGVRWWASSGHSLRTPNYFTESHPFSFSSAMPGVGGRVGPPVKRHFTVDNFNRVAQAFVAPIVDSGWFCTREVEKTLHELLKVHTQFKHLTEEKVFQETAIISIMFGNLGGGLRQKCLRDILNAALFNHDKERKVKILKSLEPKSSSPAVGSRWRKTQLSKSFESFKEWRDDHDTGGDSACVLPSLHSDSSASATAADMSRLSLSEPELSAASSMSEAATTAPFRGRTRHGSETGTTRRMIGENWLLQEDPNYTQHKVSRSLEAGMELEVSFKEDDVEENDEGVVKPGVRARVVDHSLPGAVGTVVLRSPSTELLEIGQELDKIVKSNQIRREADSEAAVAKSNPEELGLGQALQEVVRSNQIRTQAVDVEGDSFQDLLQKTKEQVESLRYADVLLKEIEEERNAVEEEAADGEGSAAASASAAAAAADSNTLFDSLLTETDIIDDAADAVFNRIMEAVGDVDDDDDDDESWSPTTSSTSSSSLSSGRGAEENSDYDSDPDGQEAFSLRHAVYAADFSNSHSLCSGNVAPSQESIIKSLNRERVAALADQIGLPHGLRLCLELEVARLQLGVAVFRHRSIDCDRGCEGDDDDDDDSDSTTDGEDGGDGNGPWGENSFSGPSLTLSENDGDTDSDDDSQLSADEVDSEYSNEGAHDLNGDRSDAVVEDGNDVMRRPYTFNSSSSSSSSTSGSDGGREEFDIRRPGNRGQRRGMAAASNGPQLPARRRDPDDWFFFNVEEEYASIRQYVRENVDQAKFENSTDSDTTTGDEEEEDKRNQETAPRSVSGAASAPIAVTATEKFEMGR